MALTSGLSDSYLRGLDVSSGVLLGMFGAAVVISSKLGRAWLPRLETSLTKHWLGQAGAEEYETLNLGSALTSPIRRLLRDTPSQPAPTE
jgi:hypothetical protein